MQEDDQAYEIIFVNPKYYGECISMSLAFPYNMVKEFSDGYEEGSERFDPSYIEREAMLLLQWLQARTRRRDKKDQVHFFNIILTPRDNRILSRWGIN